MTRLLKRVDVNRLCTTDAFLSFVSLILFHCSGLDLLIILANTFSFSFEWEFYQDDDAAVPATDVHLTADRGAESQVFAVDGSMDATGMLGHYIVLHDTIKGPSHNVSSSSRVLHISVLYYAARFFTRCLTVHTGVQEPMAGQAAV